jgi:hypothetical protein
MFINNNYRAMSIPDLIRHINLLHIRGCYIGEKDFETIAKDQVEEPLTEMNSKETLNQTNEKLGSLVKVLTSSGPKEKTIWDYTNLFVYAALGIGMIVIFYTLGYFS